MITIEDFKRATGRDPQDDDMERANCPLAGTFMHTCCGWNDEQNLPQYQVGPRTNEEECDKELLAKLREAGL